MTNFGAKISQAGIDVLTAQPEGIAFSSKYKTLRIHSRGSGSVNSSSGGGLVTIPHNLGYTPAFLVHVDPGQLGQFYIAPYVPSGIFGTPLINAYADSNNLYIKAIANVNLDTYYLDSDLNACMAREIEDVGYFTGGWTIGAGSGNKFWNGAVRFLNLDLDNSESFVSAFLKLYIASRDGSCEVKGTFWGIDEDNTAPFGSGTPATARTKTTASDNYDSTLSAGQTWSVDVKDQIAEIISRGGWGNGNALGIMFWDNETSAPSSNNGYYQIGNNSNTRLEITKSIPTIANYRYTVFLNQLE